METPIDGGTTGPPNLWADLSVLSGFGARFGKNKRLERRPCVALGLIGLYPSPKASKIILALICSVYAYSLTDTINQIGKIRYNLHYYRPLTAATYSVHRSLRPRMTNNVKCGLTCFRNCETAIVLIATACETRGLDRISCIQCSD